MTDRKAKILVLLACFLNLSVLSQTPAFQSQPLTETGDLSVQMVAGIDQHLAQLTTENKLTRDQVWHYDFSSVELFNNSVAPHRKWLSQRCGVVDNRITPKMEVQTNTNLDQFSIATADFTIRPVTWTVLEGLNAEGLLLQPTGTPARARVVLIPDADQRPELLAGLGAPISPKVRSIGQQLVTAGCEVLIPVLINRETTYSGSGTAGLFTNQTHREWIYRQSYELGRHIIGFELQKIFAAIDWFEDRNRLGKSQVPVAVAGYGEGGLLALYAAALDTRVSSTLVSGYFNNRDQLWKEPIYRNVFGLLTRFSDAEIANMCWPRKVVVEYSRSPEISVPPPPVNQRSVAAPGILSTASHNSVVSEISRAREMIPRGKFHIELIDGDGDQPLEPFSPQAVSAFAENLKFTEADYSSQVKPALVPTAWVDPETRQMRAVRGMERYIQRLLQLCEHTRIENFWEKIQQDTATNSKTKEALREKFHHQIGYLPDPHIPFNPQSRVLKETGLWTQYEIKLDVMPNVFAWGILIVPKNISEGEKHPVVVCQHGLEGLPMDIVSADTTANLYKTYQGLGTKLAENGYIVFAPHNPYRGEDKFRVLQRKANPLGLSIFSFIISQHQRILDWLGSLSYVDPQCIGFYGLSYGGKTAMRVPAVVKNYALSICSGDFNEWVRKNTSTDVPYSYMFHGEYEMPEWDLGHTFNYAEMAALIAPRPFMVERGHYDGVAVDEWVGYEFAKVRRYYSQIGYPEHCAIEYFDGGHKIHGEATFDFLDRHLKDN